MGIFALPLLFLVYWIIDKIQKHQRNKDHEKYQEHLKEMGLK